MWTRNALQGNRQGKIIALWGLTNTFLLLVIIHFVLISVVLNIESLIYYVILRCVATLVQCVWFSSSIFLVLHVCVKGFV